MLQIPSKLLIVINSINFEMLSISYYLFIILNNRDSTNFDKKDKLTFYPLIFLSYFYRIKNYMKYIFINNIYFFFCAVFNTHMHTLQKVIMLFTEVFLHTIINILKKY